MELRRYLLILKVFILLEEFCICFNIDVKRARIFNGPADALFGYKVLQHEAEGQKWMLVGAPWDGPANNRKGDVYKCIVGEERHSNCTKVNLGDTALQNVSKQIRNTHFGMTLAENKGEGFVACAPLWSQECGTSVFSNGICAKVDQNFHPTETIAPTAQRCSTFMDIVIVLDGSNSIYPWYEVQNFLSNILSKFHISPEQMQVGVLQYAEVSVHEWSLHDYQTTEEVVEAAKNISRQEGRETRTAYAIHMGCSEAFSPERGAREGATKVMIVVTDGESHDGEELPEALAECEKRNITRYAIAWPLIDHNHWWQASGRLEKPRPRRGPKLHHQPGRRDQGQAGAPSRCPCPGDRRTSTADTALPGGRVQKGLEAWEDKREQEAENEEEPESLSAGMVLGHYIRRQQDPETFISEIKYIASDPDEKYFFNVTDEAALNDIVDALGDRIFSLEGTLGSNESSFETEMSQIGFSAHMLEDGILFGMVGAYDWDGGVLKEGRQGRIMPPREAFKKEFPLELKKHSAYLGYTVSSVALKNGKRPLCCRSSALQTQRESDPLRSEKQRQRHHRTGSQRRARYPSTALHPGTPTATAKQCCTPL
ncbi:integrin alpha-10-like [Acipenser ruthenus]|uniref:integrin alpha-10-like n=1 Tax=Acipenser ruthenus TaxID=7906 RepID=UPI00274131A0|nr:integrin alpha-10-like [Acipenser ruthenus]